MRFHSGLPGRQEGLRPRTARAVFSAAFLSLDTVLVAPLLLLRRDWIDLRTISGKKKASLLCRDLGWLPSVSEVEEAVCLCTTELWGVSLCLNAASPSVAVFAVAQFRVPSWPAPPRPSKPPCPAVEAGRSRPAPQALFVGVWSCLESDEPRAAYR